MTPVIRPAREEDIDSLQDAEGRIFGGDAWSPEVVRAELSHPASFYFVLDDEGIIVGYGGLRSPEPARPGDIQTLAVEADYRRAGWGGRLLDALLDVAAARAVPEIFLEVRADNDTARALYEKRGFREIDRRRGYYQPDGVDAVVMRRPGHLPQGAKR